MYRAEATFYTFVINLAKIGWSLSFKLRRRLAGRASRPEDGFETHDLRRSWGVYSDTVCTFAILPQMLGQSFHDNFNLDSLREIDSKLSFLTKRGSLQQEEIDEIVMQIGQNFERCAEASFGRVKRPIGSHPFTHLRLIFTLNGKIE